jgi:hypothetical protein
MVSSATATLLEAGVIEVLVSVSKFTATSDSGEFAERWITNGGGAGRKYRPKANAPIAMAQTITSGFVTLLPSLDAQSSQRAPSQARHPLRVSLAPQFAQKFERLIVGVSGSSADYIWNGTELRGVELNHRGHRENQPKQKNRKLDFSSSAFLCVLCV